MSCPDLCTAEKCRALEERIGSLEQGLALLEAAFEAHIVQDIPTAHDYKPLVKVNTAIANNILTTDVTVDQEQDSDQANLDIFEPSVTFDIFPIDDNNYEFKVSVNGNEDSDTLTLSPKDLDITLGIDSQNEIYVSLQLGAQFAYDSTPLPNSNVSVDVFDQGDEQVIKVQVGNNSDQDFLILKETSFSMNGSYRNEILSFTYSHGNNTNSFQIPIPIDNEIINNINNYYGGGEGGDTLNCSNIETQIEDCCEQILTAIGNLQTNVIGEIYNSENILSSQINDTESRLTNNIQTINDAVCIDITGTTSGEYSCEFEADEQGNIIPTYAVSKVKDKSYQGKGFLGVHEVLKLIQENLTYLHSDICKAVDPLHTIKLEDIYNFCNKSGIKRSDYQDGTQGDLEYEEAIKDYLQGLLIDSKYGYLINQLTDQNPTDLITAPTNWSNFILTDFALIQSRINREAICGIEIPENPDVVTIVASEKELHRVEGKQLIIQFVTLDNYPKRSSSSSYRPIQIPAPKESYDWDTNFKNLRWQQGNQYAELVVEGWKHGVSGWFADITAADAFFDAVLNLTTALETNRLYPVHKTPKTNIPIRETRPWRAFIAETDNQGNATTLIKYFPPANE